MKSIGFSDSYKDSKGNTLLSLDLRPYGNSTIFKRSRVDLLTGFIYDNPDFPSVWCDPGRYDGYSIPHWVSLITFGVMSQIMPVIECTLPHDVVCAKGMLTKEMRQEIFKHAYDDAVAQFYGGIYPDRRRDYLVRGVVVGSDFGAC